MTETLTAAYESATQAENAVDDLIASGIPQENVFLDDKTNQVKVSVPEDSAPTIQEILERHRRS
jgi:hypothetical protein